jgi:hypothetical protein
MRWPRIFRRTRREHAEAYSAWVLRTEAALLRRREERAKRSAASRAGQATRVRQAYQGDRLLNERVEF